MHLLDRADIESWVATRARTASKKTKRPPAPKTIRNEHGLISTILAHAETRGWVRTNVAKGVRLPAKTHAELELLTDQEFLALHAAITDRYKPLVWLLGATGLRWGEATALTWRDVGPDWIAVRQAWKHDEHHGRILGAPKTRRAARRIVTTPAVIAMLGERGGADEFVFTNARGGSVKHSTFWESHWKPACTAVGLSPVPKIHSLRHWGASYMLAQGADLFEVSRALGHGHLHDEQRVRPSGPVPDPPDGDACSEARGAAAHPHGMSNAPTRTGRGRSCRLRSPSPCCPGVPTRASRPPDRRTAPSRGSTRSGSE